MGKCLEYAKSYQYAASSTEIEYMEEPIVTAQYNDSYRIWGNIWNFAKSERGIFLNMEYMEEKRVILHYELPLNEVIYDFFDALKSKTKRICIL